MFGNKKKIDISRKLKKKKLLKNFKKLHFFQFLIAYTII